MQRPPEEYGDRAANRGQAPDIGRHRVIREVAADHLGQPTSLLRDRRMHALTQFHFEGLQLDPHTVPA
jgi:hypothetical protein